MRHHIIVKWNNLVNDKDSLIPDIEKLFSAALEIKGIHSVEIHKNVIDRANRYDLMIVLVMEKSALEEYDNSVFHKEWKNTYSKYIESKAIFDCD
ncbi:MAG: hypothetical protein MJ236_03550 [Clostridia bacterium]|nr:hypothetical protein [Clostridia bacterium]